MPLYEIPGTDLTYYLIAFDELGFERPEADGLLLSDTVSRVVASRVEPVTDVFLGSHGWKGDVPAAIEQYEKWIPAMAAVEADRETARARRPGFNSLIIGLHWPSLPFGDESLPPQGGAVLGAQDEISREVDAYAKRIANTPRARGAIRAIVEAARDSAAQSGPLPRRVQDAYTTLFAESGLGTGGAGAPPGFDQDAFDPAAIARDFTSSQQGARGANPQLLGLGDTIRDAIVSPLRQLSFWKMKDRARQFGETGAHRLIARLQGDAPRARFHLMGHSFGCIVVSAAVAGAPDSRKLPRPVDSLFLVQGALSLWSYARDIPYARNVAGYFHRIVKQGLVAGPIVTTRSTHDTAVGRLYPLGARVRKQLVLGDSGYPEYGGIGTFGIQGVAGVVDMPMQKVGAAYAFRAGMIYNLEASGVIRNGGGASGAHSDIAHPEVAHAFWAAVLAGGDDFLGADSTLSGAVGDREAAAASDWSASTRRAGGGLLSGVTGGLASEGPAAPVPPATDRWINAQIEDRAADQPLTAGRWYSLAFDVSVGRAASADASALIDERMFAAGVAEVALTVQLDSDDFDIAPPAARTLTVPRTGPSPDKAAFGISPRHDGPSLLVATIHRDGNFVQRMEIRFDVGSKQPSLPETLSRGRPIAAASVVRHRDIGMTISRVAGGYECIAVGSVAGRARLPLEPAYLESAINAARDELLRVVMLQGANGDYVFQGSIDIPNDARDAALEILARAGASLFRKLFFGPGAGDDSKRVGEFLRKAAADRGTRLKLQIVAETAPVPWGLLYVGDAAAGTPLDWDNFIGMRHIVENIPLQNTFDVPGNEMSSQPSLAVSVNLNEAIDRQMGADFVAQQARFWKAVGRSRKGIAITGRTTSKELVRALADGETADQILYFYCHAVAAGLTAQGGPDASALELTDAAITLGDLNLDAPTSTPFRANPLVFINACESAQMSPTFYDGFAPYFMAKGARGVIGTECKAPALFASEWAQRFFGRFLDGEPLGEAFLALRREFLERHGNPLGLMYAVHCDADTRITPALGTG